MANAQAWELGAQQGAALAGERRAHKQALADEDLHRKAKMYAQSLTDYRDKAQLYKDTDPAKYQDAIAGMTSTLSSLRELYHHDNNPNAIAKFGHILTDALKITNPLQRSQRETQKKANALDADKTQAGAIAAGLVSPEEMAKLGVRTDAAKNAASYEANKKLYKDTHLSATDEQAADYADTQLPGYAKAGNWEIVNGTLNGQPYSLSYDKKTGLYELPDGTLSSTAPPGFMPTPKGAGGRPVQGSHPVNLESAKALSLQGITYKDRNGNDIDLAKIPDGMMLVPMFENGREPYWYPAPDPGTYQTGNNLRKWEPKYGPPNPNAPNIGAARVPTQRQSVTPGPSGPVVTSSVTTPVTGGGVGTSAPKTVVPPQSAPLPSGAAQGKSPASLRKTHPAATQVAPTPAPTPSPTSAPAGGISAIPPIRDPKLPPMRGADEQRISNIERPVHTLEQQLVGRDVTPLWEYSNVLNNKELLSAVNKAMLAPMLQTPEGTTSTGFWETITRALGLASAAQAVTSWQIVSARDKVQKMGGLDALNFLDRLAELKGTVPLLRTIQGGSSALGAMAPLLQESPILNISSPQDFRYRTANMIRTMASALEGTRGINPEHVDWLYKEAKIAEGYTPQQLKVRSNLMNYPSAGGPQ